MTPLPPMRGGGQFIHIPGTSPAASGKRLERALKHAQVNGDHVWCAFLIHTISPGALERLETDPPLFDAESLAGVQLGCYACEQQYQPRLRLRRCPGEPRR